MILKKWIEFYFFTPGEFSSDDYAAKINIDWFTYKDYVFGKTFTGFDKNGKWQGKYNLNDADVEKMRHTPQYKWGTFLIKFLSYGFQINLRLKKTGMSRLYKIKLGDRDDMH